MHTCHLIERLRHTRHPLISIYNVTEGYFDLFVAGPPLLVSLLNTHPPFDLLYFLSHLKYLGIRTGYLESEIFLYLLVIGDIVVWDSHSFVVLQV